MLKDPEIGFQRISEEFSLVSAAFQSAFLWRPEALMAGNTTETSDSSQFQTSGNALALPLACYMPAGSYADRAGYPWCRLPALQGSSGNAISLTINSKNTSTAWTTSSQSTRILSAAAPFYGSPVDPLSCD